MTISKPAAGVYTPSITFFKDNSTATKSARVAVDLEAQLKHTLYLAESGLDGVVLLGSTGEMIHLNQSERAELVKFVADGVAKSPYAGKFKIMAGVAQHGIDDTLSDIKSVAQAGAEFAMVLAPNYFGAQTPQAGIVEWFLAVAEESALPVVIYYFPGVSNNIKITIDSFEKLAAHPNIVGVKLSHGDVSSYAQLALNPNINHDTFSTLTGLGQVLLPAMSVGVEGTIDAMSGVYPKTLKKLWTLASEGKYKEAQSIQYTVSCVEELVATYGPRGMKYIYNRVLGYGSPAGRAPMGTPLSASEVAPFDKAIEAAIKLEKSL